MDGTTTHGQDALQCLALQLRNSIKSWKAKPAKSRRSQSHRVESVWLLCWLLKDLGWVLLCGPLAWPAALAALTLQAQDVLQQWKNSPRDEWVHSLAILGWLCGSSVWMTAQLLFEPVVHKGRASPWYSGAIFTANAEHYHWGVFLMQAIDITTLLGLLGFYAMHLLDDASIITDWNWKASANPTGDIIRQRKAAMDDRGLPASAASNFEGLVFGVMKPEVYSKIFIMPWILKDLFWVNQSFIPAIICILLVTVLMADYFWLCKQWKNLAMLLWTTGSAVWLSNDLVMHEAEMWPLLLSILFFAVAGCMLAGVIVARPPRDDFPLMGSKEEHDPLL